MKTFRFLLSSFFYKGFVNTDICFRIILLINNVTGIKHGSVFSIAGKRYLVRCEQYGLRLRANGFISRVLA